MKCFIVQVPGLNEAAKNSLKTNQQQMLFIDKAIDGIGTHQRDAYMYDYAVHKVAVTAHCKYSTTR